MFLKKILVILMLGCGCDQLAAAKSLSLRVKTDISPVGFKEHFIERYFEPQARYTGRVPATESFEIRESGPEGFLKLGFINDLDPKSGLVRCISCGELVRCSAKSFFKAP